MNAIVPLNKPVSTNPLKLSAPLGAAMAYLGIEGAVPLFHGSQGCTAFALVLLVRHFKETAPVQTTAMNEVSTILGGADHVEEALINIKKRANPKLIGIASTALTETRGEDFEGDLRLILLRRADELAGTEVVFASTPDFEGSLEEGWAKATRALVHALVPPGRAKVTTRRVNILPGQHVTAGDIEAIKDIISAFDLDPVFLPDISGSLDGITTGEWFATTYGGTTIEQIRTMGEACATFSIGEHMRETAVLLEERTGVPSVLLDSLTGLDACDKFMVELSQIAGKPVPQKLQRERARLIDAMLDGHFSFAGKRIAIATEPDLLYATASLMHDMGAEIAVAVTTTGHSPVLAKVPAKQVLVGDLGDLERRAVAIDLIATHSHGRQAAHRLHVPHLRIGFPIFDRLGTAYRTTAGYAGTRNMIFEIANLFLSEHHDPSPESLDPFRARLAESLP